MEFKVNEIISLKLNGKETRIFLNGELFQQCKRLTLNILKSNFEKYDNLNSIDDLIENRFQDHSVKISPKEEFWGHCSNIQGWVDNDYDTRLLDMRLAFPLLKRLADLGDTRAKMRFAEEVVKRYNEGSENVRDFLTFQNYLKYLPDYEYLYHLLEEDDANTTISIIKKYGKKMHVEERIYHNEKTKESYIVIKDRHVSHFSIWIDDECPFLPSEIAEFSQLTLLCVEVENKELVFPRVEFHVLKYLSIYIRSRKCKLDLGNLNYFKNLRRVYIEGMLKVANHVITFNFNFSEIDLLEEITVKHSKLKYLPNHIAELNFLKRLILFNCILEDLPKDIGECKNLEILCLDGTSLQSALPRSLLKNKSVKYFACSPENLTDEVKEWIKKQELEYFKENTWINMYFFDYPIIE